MPQVLLLLPRCCQQELQDCVQGLQDSMNSAAAHIAQLTCIMPPGTTAGLASALLPCPHTSDIRANACDAVITTRTARLCRMLC